MNNFEIAKLVEEITQPYFSFSDDFYGDVKSCNIPNVEDMDILFFKKNGRNRNLIITKDEENIIVEKVKKNPKKEKMLEQENKMKNVLLNVSKIS